MKSHFSFLAVVLLSSCGGSSNGADKDAAPAKIDAGSSAQAPLYSSGSRLKAVFDDGGEGSTRLIHWNDTGINQRCAFEMDENWDYRCFPKEKASKMFEDAACAKPIGRGAAGGDEGTLVSVAMHDRCARGRGRYQIFSLGALLEPTEIFSFAGDECRAQPAYSLTYRQLEAVALTTLVGASVRDEAMDDSLARRYLDAEDGATEVLTFASVEHGVQCFPFPSDTGESHCIPGDLVNDSNDAMKAGCSERVAYSMGANVCERSQYVLRTDSEIDEGCGSHSVHTLLNLGTEVPAEEVFHKFQESCTQHSVSIFRYWEIGSAVPFTEIAETPTFIDIPLGSGAARPMAYATQAGIPLKATSGWVNSDGNPCLAYNTGLNEMRCLNGATRSTFNQTTYWADAACSAEPLYQSHHSEECQEPWTPPSLLIETNNAAPTGVDQAGRTALGLRVLASPYEGPVYEGGGESGGCAVLNETEPGTHYQAIGEIKSFDDSPLIQVKQDS